MVSVANEAPTSNDGEATTDLAYNTPTTKLWSPTPSSSSRRRASVSYDSRRRAAVSYDSRRRASYVPTYDSGRRRCSYVVYDSRRRYGVYDSRRRSVYIHSSGSMACFPSSAKVQSQERGAVPITEVKVGEKVQTHDGYSKILFFAKWQPEVSAEHVRITTENATLTLSASHALFFSDGKPVLAHRVTEGHELLTAGRVMKVERLKGTGLVAPVTAHGTLVVDGVTTSDYGPLSESMGQGAAHMALAPLRLLHWAFPGLDLWHGGHDETGTHPLMRWGTKLFKFN